VIAAFHTLGAVEKQHVSTGAFKGLHDDRFRLGDSD
jgi:hypothetical protein